MSSMERSLFATTRGIYLGIGLLFCLPSVLTAACAIVFPDFRSILLEVTLGLLALGIPPLIIRRHLEQRLCRIFAFFYSGLSLLQFPIGTVLHAVAIHDLYVGQQAMANHVENKSTEQTRATQSQ